MSDKNECIPTWQWIAPVFMLIFAGPYVYYSILINKAAHENPREGYKFPKIADFWMSIVGAIVSVTLKEFMPRLIQPYFINHVKETEDREM